MAHQARTYLGFSSMEWLGVFLLPPGWYGSQSQEQGSPLEVNLPVPIYTPWGRYSQKNWVVVCSSKTFTLFLTKICDFPYAIYDLTKNAIIRGKPYGVGFI